MVYIFVKMLAVYTVLLLTLIGSGILSSSVHAKSSKSSGSGDRNQKGYCKNSAISIKTVEEKIKYLAGCKATLPSCEQGLISKIDVYNGNSRKTTTVLTCSGCASPQVPITCSSDCKNVLDIFRHDLDKFCEVAFSQCKNITIYRCGSPSIPTTDSTKAPTTLLKTTVTSTAAPTTTVATTTTSTAAPTTTVATTTTSTATPTPNPTNPTTTPIAITASNETLTYPPTDSSVLNPEQTTNRPTVPAPTTAMSIPAPAPGFTPFHDEPEPDYYSTYAA